MGSKTHTELINELEQRVEWLEQQLEAVLDAVLPVRLNRDLAGPLCVLEGRCARMGECHDDCEFSSKVQEAWSQLRAKLIAQGESE